MWNKILDVINSYRKADVMYAEVLANLTKAAAPRRSVDDLYSEFVIKADLAVRSMQ